MSIEMVMEYDSSVLEPYTWEFEGDTYGIAVLQIPSKWKLLQA